MVERTMLSAIFDQSSGMDKLFTKRFYGSKGYEGLAKKGNVVLFLWGGEDISASLYNQKPYKWASLKLGESRRDTIEKTMAQWAIENGFPIVGICRGAQMMCALSGGKLVQDVNGHFGTHPIYCKEIVPGLGDVESVSSSIHHQMMIPDGVDHQLIAWPTPSNRSDIYTGEDNKNIESCLAPDWKEPEIVWFPKTKSLCIQGHPEYMKNDAPFVQLVNQLIEYFCFNNKPQDETPPDRG